MSDRKHTDTRHYMASATVFAATHHLHIINTISVLGPDDSVCLCCLRRYHLRASTSHFVSSAETLSEALCVNIRERERKRERMHKTQNLTQVPNHLPLQPPLPPKQKILGQHDFIDQDFKNVSDNTSLRVGRWGSTLSSDSSLTALDSIRRFERHILALG